MFCSENRINMPFLTTSQERKLKPWNDTNFILGLFVFLCKKVHDTIDERSEIIRKNNTVASINLDFIFVSTSVKMPNLHFWRHPCCDMQNIVTFLLGFNGICSFSHGDWKLIIKRAACFPVLLLCSEHYCSFSLEFDD